MPIDLFRQLLAETSYSVRFHDDHWIECFVSNGPEHWHGRGVDQTEALEDVLRQMMPSALARNLLERRATPPAPEPEVTEVEMAETAPRAEIVEDGAGASPCAEVVEEALEAAPHAEVAQLAPPPAEVADAAPPPAEIAQVVEAPPPTEGAEVEHAAPPAEAAHIVGAHAEIAQVVEAPLPAEGAEIEQAAPPPAEAVEVEPAAPPPAEAVEVEPAAPPPAEAAEPTAPPEAAETAPAESAPAESAPTTSRPAGRAARVLSALKIHRGAEQPENHDAGVMIPERGLFMVAAGMGAAPRGGAATKMAIEIVQKTIEAEPAPSSLRGKGLPALVTAIERANADIYAAARRDAELKGMGATFAAALAMGRSVGLAHVGDSRIYRLRRGGIEPLTADHVTARRTRALGTSKTVEVETSVVTGQPGDVLLLCTPGLHRAVGDDDISRILGEHESPEAASEQLVARALAAGSSGSATALVLRWER